MSMPYRQDRIRERRDEGEQPYQDAREALSESEAELDRTASTRDGFHEAESEEERHTRQEAEAGERLGEIGDEVADEREPS